MPRVVQTQRGEFAPNANLAWSLQSAPPERVARRLDGVMTLVAIAATTAESWLSTACACAAAILASRGWIRLRGTTLAAPMAWAAAAAAGVAAVEGVLAWSGGPTSNLSTQLARYAAATATYCPLMAVLGAKRPQDRGWQWVVLTLWIVLLAPAGQALVARAGSSFELPVPWLVTLTVLSGVGLLNYLPTRWAIPAVIFAAGQVLLAAYPEGEIAGVEHVAVATMAMFAAALIPSLVGPASRNGTAAEPLDVLTARWLAFRNGWGAFWALRVMRRVNEAAEFGGWPVRLAWQGFTAPEISEAAELDERTQAQIKQALDAVLWRFERRDSAVAKPDPVQ